MTPLVSFACVRGSTTPIWGFEATDYVQEGPREDLQIQPILQLPFHPVLLVAVAIGIPLISAVILSRIVG